MVGRRGWCRKSRNKRLRWIHVFLNNAAAVFIFGISFLSPRAFSVFGVRLFNFDEITERGRPKFQLPYPDFLRSSRFNIAGQKWMAPMTEYWETHFSLLVHCPYCCSQFPHFTVSASLATLWLALDSNMLLIHILVAILFSAEGWITVCIRTRAWFSVEFWILAAC